MSAESIWNAMFALMHFHSRLSRLIRRAPIMADWKTPPVTLWCRVCSVGYYSKGEVPATCPRCDQYADWTTTPPYKLTMDDRDFLRCNRIDPEC